MIRSILAQNLKRARTAAGLTQGDLAAASGVGKSTITKIELETNAASIDTLAALAEALNTTPASLLEDRRQPIIKAARLATGLDRDVIAVDDIVSAATEAAHAREARIIIGTGQASDLDGLAGVVTRQIGELLVALVHVDPLTIEVFDEEAGSCHS